MRRFASLPPIVENAAWILGSLILAVFIWIAATTEQNPVTASAFGDPIAIQIEIDEGMIVTNNPPTTAEVILRTQQSVWEVLEAEDITARADLTGLPPGTYTIELAIEVATARRVVVEDWRPRQITVAIDRAAEILVPVNPDIRSQPPTGFEATGITFNTNQIRVTGPAAQVERVTTADARLRLNNQRGLFTDELRLWPVDSDGNIVANVTLVPETVEVTVNIEPSEDFREVFVTPNISGEPPEGYVIQSIIYEPQTVLVSGRPNALEQLPGTILTDEINLTERTGSFSQTVGVELPTGVFLATGQNIVVTVDIEPLPGSRSFDNLPVGIEGLDPDLNAVLTPAQVSVFITGPAALLNMLTLDDIAIVADLTDLRPGTHEVPLQPIISREGLERATVTVLPAVLDVQITPNSPAATPVQPLIETPTPFTPPPAGSGQQ